MGRLSPTPSTSSEGSSHGRDASATPSAKDATSSSGGAPSTRNFKASQAASLAAVVESTSAHRAIVPGLAELMGGSSVVGMIMNANNLKSGGSATAAPPGDSGGAAGGSSEDPHTRIMHAGEDDNAAANNANAMEVEPTTATAAGHPSLPSVEAVSTAASRLINESPPFVIMSARDSAPQLKLEDPIPVDDAVGENQNENNDKDGTDKAFDFQRKLVVKGGMKGYRMSRATHGATTGCYYYEAIILGAAQNSEQDGSVKSERGVKRPLHQMEDKSTKDQRPNNTSTTKGHLRMGWSTRNGDLQAPVGYNEHSYAIRDISGSRIHKSRREDKWAGGEGFAVGDVVGCMICLMESKKTPSPSGESSAAAAAAAATMSSINSDVDMDDAENKDSANTSTDLDPQKTQQPLANHIRFFKNGRAMGKTGVAFHDVIPGTYHPAVSCYMDGSAQLNFGPHFVYPPKDVPADTKIIPVSELCPMPPLPEDAMEFVLSTGGSGGNGSSGTATPKKIFFSKRTNDGIVAAFKELVRTEATVRREAHEKHLGLHRREIAAMRRERGLDATLS